MEQAKQCAICGTQDHLEHEIMGQFFCRFCESLLSDTKHKSSLNGSLKGVKF